MPPYTDQDEVLDLYRKFRTLWVRQGDMMDREDRKRAERELAKMSDRLRELEKM